MKAEPCWKRASGGRNTHSREWTTCAARAINIMPPHSLRNVRADRAFSPSWNITSRKVAVSQLRESVEWVPIYVVGAAKGAVSRRCLRWKIVYCLVFQFHSLESCTRANERCCCGDGLFWANFSVGRTRSRGCFCRCGPFASWRGRWKLRRLHTPLNFLCGTKDGVKMRANNVTLFPSVISRFPKSWFCSILFKKWNT